MSSRTSINITSGEANRSGSDIQRPVLPQDRNQSEMDIIEDLRMKLQALERKNLELTSQHNQDMSQYEKELMKLRLELERGEALRRVLESEMSLARKDTQVQMYSVEDELWDAKAKLLELQAGRSEPRQQAFTYGSGESLWFSFPPEENITPHGPAPDVHWGPSRHRYCPLPRPAISSGGTLYVTCPTPGTDTSSSGTLYVTCPTPGTDITSESLPSPFIPRGVSTPLRPDVPASWRELSDEVFTSGRELTDEVFTPARPISDEVFTPARSISDEVFTPGGRELSDKYFTNSSRREFDPNYSRHFGPLRPLANRTADRVYYTRSDSDLNDSLWVYHQPNLIRISIPSGRSGSFQRPITSMYVQVSPTGIGTTSRLDDSSRIRPLRSFTMSTPSWERIRAPVATPVRPPAPVNASFRVRPRRAHSIPPFRSASQGISPNTRRINEI